MPDYFIVVAPEKRAYPVEELNSLVKFGKLKIYGPYPQETLLAYYREGRVKDDTLIYCDDGQPTRTFLAIYTELQANLPFDSPAAQAARERAAEQAQANRGKTRRRALFALLATLAVALAAGAYYLHAASSQHLFEQTRDAVVAIKAYDASGKIKHVGSGFYVDFDTVVTAGHIVDRAARIELIAASGAAVKEYGVLKSAEKSDLAYIRTATGSNRLPLRDLGAATIGDRVIALDQRTEAGFALAEGRLSVIRRSADGSHAAQLLLTPTVADENCGSPVVNARGEAIGMLVPAGPFEKKPGANYAAPVKPFTGTVSALTSSRFPLSAERFEPYYSSKSLSEERDLFATASSYRETETTRLVNAGAINRFADDRYNVWIRSSLSTTLNGSPTERPSDGVARELANYAVDCQALAITPLSVCAPATSASNESDLICTEPSTPYQFSASEVESLCEYLHALPPELD